MSDHYDAPDRTMLPTESRSTIAASDGAPFYGASPFASPPGLIFRERSELRALKRKAGLRIVLDLLEAKERKAFVLMKIFIALMALAPMTLFAPTPGDPVPVPDVGATALLAGIAFLSLAAARRYFRR